MKLVAQANLQDYNTLSRDGQDKQHGGSSTSSPCSIISVLQAYWIVIATSTTAYRYADHTCPLVETVRLRFVDWLAFGWSLL